MLPMLKSLERSGILIVEVASPSPANYGSWGELYMLAKWENGINSPSESQGKAIAKNDFDEFCTWITASGELNFIKCKCITHIAK